MYLDQTKVTFTRSGIVASSEMHPCTDEEVAVLEQQIGQPLPAAYREFLLWIGHGAGIFLQGSDAFYQHLNHLRQSAQDLLLENNITATLPEDVFVFYMHQGYQFMFFRLSEGDDPPVYYFGEGEGQDTFTLLYPHYSKFLDTEIEGHAASLRNMQMLIRKADVREPGTDATK